MFAIFETISAINVLRGFPKHLINSCDFITARIPVICCGRSYSDTSKSDNKKAVVKAQGTETEQRLRVRLTRPSDVPRVLKFVREQARIWPGPLAPPSNLIFGDYVARTLAQGHSMLAEQHPNTNRSEILGLALTAALCPWDADVLDRWARCVKCSRSKRLISFTAHCLRAPNLHENYDVDKILQVILIVPPDKPKSVEIAHALAKNAIKRGKDIGFPLVRFDVNKHSEAALKLLPEAGNKLWDVADGGGSQPRLKRKLKRNPIIISINISVALAMVGPKKDKTKNPRVISSGDLNLKKEWQVSYKIVDISLQEDCQSNVDNSSNETNNISRNYVSVYTATPDDGRKQPLGST